MPQLGDLTNRAGLARVKRYRLGWGCDRSCKYGSIESLAQKVRALPVVGGSLPRQQAGSTGVRFGCVSAFQKWLAKGSVDFLEIYCGYGEFTSRVREAEMLSGEGIDNRVVSYGQVWPLEEKETRAQLAWLI